MNFLISVRPELTAESKARFGHWLFDHWNLFGACLPAVALAKAGDLEFGHCLSAEALAEAENLFGICDLGFVALRAITRRVRICLPRKF